MLEGRLPHERQFPWFVGGLAALLALCMHAPALQRLGTHLPGEAASDVLRAWWSAWLVARELPGWPFDSAAANFPDGVALVPFPAVSLVLAAPLARLAGAAVAITTLAVVHTAFAFVASAVLVRGLGGGWGGAVLAGALVATQPILGGALRDGTIEVLAVGWLPLTLWAMVKACRGSPRWGVAAGLLFLVTCLESVYYGSFTALGVVVTLLTLRGRRGLLGAAAAGVTVLAGVMLLSLVFEPVLEGVGTALDTARQDPTALRRANAADLEVLRQLALSPGSRGWRVSDLYAPPLAHWVVFALGALLCLRRAPWLTLLAGLYLLLALDHTLVEAWSESVIGHVVRFPRRYMAAFAVALGCGVGVGAREILRWPRAEAVVGLVGGAFLAWVGAFSSGHLLAYPLLELPDPAFARVVADDDERAAILLLPLETPGASYTMRTEAPVFASLPTDIASADLLALQVLSDKDGWYTPKLVTLRVLGQEGDLLSRSLSDMARPRFGQQLPASARMELEEYGPWVRWLEGEGLKYVAVSKDAYRQEELDRIAAILGEVAEVRDFDDGTGVRLFRLYDERPARQERPVEGRSAVVVPQFKGVVVAEPYPEGDLEVRLTTAGQPRRCPVDLNSHRFDCGDVAVVDQVELLLDAQPINVAWNGSMFDAVLTIGGTSTTSDPGNGGDSDVFSGHLLGREGLVGMLEIEATVGDRVVRCPITPETGQFRCGGVPRADAVRVLMEKREVPSTWDGKLTDAAVRVTAGGG